MARARSALLSDLIALVAVVATTVVALVSLWFNTRQSEKQFQRDLIKQDQAELRAVLDATTATAARVGGDYVLLASNWIRDGQTSKSRLERGLAESTAVAARLAVRLKEDAPLPRAYQDFNRKLVVIRNGMLYKRRRDARESVTEAAFGLADAIAEVWNAAHALGNSRLTEDDFTGSFERPRRMMTVSRPRRPNHRLDRSGRNWVFAVHAPRCPQRQASSVERWNHRLPPGVSCA